MEVGQLCSLVLHLKNDTRAIVRLLGVFAVPPLSLPGFNWRHCKHAILQPSTTSLLTATIQPTSAELGRQRTLLVVCCAGGDSLALPLDVSVIPSDSRADVELLKATSAYTPKPSRVPTAASHVAEFRIIAGERPAGKLSAKQLYTRKLHHFDLPTWVTNSCTSKGSQPDAVVSALSATLTAASHASRFSLLLWLEEWQMLADIQSYDTQSAFSKHPDHRGLLALTVPGLAEGRPSVLVGDRILVSELPFDRSTPAPSSALFAGFVWRVEQDWLYLRFHDDFLGRWLSGKKFYVRFSFDRVSMRRAHQGLTVPNAHTMQRFFSPAPAVNPATPSPAASVVSSPPRSQSQSASSSVGKYDWLATFNLTLMNDCDECDKWIRENVLHAALDEVGLDLEFHSTGATEAIALVQIATMYSCLVFSPGSVSSDKLPRSLVYLLCSSDTRKLSVGHQDKEMMERCWRLRTARVVDIQQQLMQTLRMTRRPGLERMVNAFLPHLPYSKSKDLQRADFTTWPLPFDRTQYAASDAVLTLLLGQQLDDLSPPEMKKRWDTWAAGEALRTKEKEKAFRPQSSTQPAPVILPRQTELPEVTFYNRRLNQPQQDAVRGVCAGLHHPFPYVVFGPPGTGSKRCSHSPLTTPAVLSLRSVAT